MHVISNISKFTSLKSVIYIVICVYQIQPVSIGAAGDAFGERVDEDGTSPSVALCSPPYKLLPAMLS